ncbi:polysaccharide biosynthesis/export family protein [Chitinophaga sp.]|uniref:polysaccharide biosynthesis/export family protein n=1 Tax=Chitinophaga sp. TaxID=1869181 RepID=UPI0031E2B105
MKFRIHLLLISSLFLLASCIETKKITYLNDIQQQTGEETGHPLQPLKVQPGDVLQITVTTIDKDISQILNPAAVSSVSTTANGIDPGYIVDSEGYINLPMAGRIYVKDKTTSEINTVITTELDKSIRNAFVSTRITNFKISVLGDVARPGSFKIGAERVSILDALSMAGDMNVTALHDNVTVIREVDGVKKYVALNLNDSKILSSPYYYLNNNDVVYVRPGKNKVFNSSKFVTLIPTMISALSLITTLIIVTVK